MNQGATPNIIVKDMCIGKDQYVSALIETFPFPARKESMTADGTAVPVNTGIKADENKKYVQWGVDNKFPSHIVAKANQSPYVAPALNHLINNTFSEGIKAYYVCYLYRNGKIEREQIDYEAAGLWIKGRIQDLKREEQLSQEPNAFGGRKVKSSYAEEIKQLEADLMKWEETMKEWNDFKIATNLDHWLMEQSSDATYFWNWWPTLHLNVGKPNETWKPKVKRLSYLEATCTRNGIMDRYGDINYCVYSRSFGTSDESSLIASNNPDDTLRQTVITALPTQNPGLKLQEKVNSQINNRPKNRTLDYVIPMNIPTPGRFYYSTPSWHTIFHSGIFNYMIAMFYRRGKMMENATMFKYIIRIDTEYVDYMCSLKGAISDKERQQVFNEICDSIEKFLQDPKNSGKTLMTVEKTIDGKKMKWVEIEMIESPLKGSDVKEDIEEIANVMLFAAGIHPQTVGAIPGKAKVASGTEARELNLLNQLSLFAIKKQLMTPLYVTKSFNQWDDHLYFDIPVHVLTTLDKNKQGVEELNTNN